MLDHAGRGDDYDVSITITADRCELRVVDVGHGFDHASVIQRALAGSDLAAERGRGLMLMHALVDHIELLSQPAAGTLVRLVKHLRFRHDAPHRPCPNPDEPGMPDPTLDGGLRASAAEHERPPGARSTAGGS